jgi:hypothetical protein
MGDEEQEHEQDDGVAVTPRSMPESGRGLRLHPRVLLPWSHYPSVCGRWFGSYPPRRTRSNSIAAFVEVWRFTCRVTILGAAPTTDLLGRSGELPLMCGFTPTPPGLRPSGASIANLAGGLSYLARHTGHLFTFGFCLRDRGSSQELQTCDDACVQWLSPPFELRNATHRLPFTCRLLDGVSRPRPHRCGRSLSLCAITLADKARMAGTTLGHAGSQAGSS